VAGLAVFAGAIAQRKRDHNLVTDRDAADLLTDRNYLPSRFVAENLPTTDFIVVPLAVALPRVVIAATEPTGFDGDDRSVWRRVWWFSVDDIEWFAVLAEDSCAHSFAFVGTGLISHPAGGNAFR
jgi:hypothetical protein